MQEVTLSNDPKTGFARVAKDMEFILNERDRTCVLDLNIHYKKDGQAIIVKGFTFKATDEYMVDSNGDVTQLTSEYEENPLPESVKTVYQHFEDLQYAPVSTAQIKESVIRAKESSGVFDV